MNTQPRNPAARNVQANPRSTPSPHQRVGMSSVRRARLRSALLQYVHNPEPPGLLMPTPHSLGTPASVHAVPSGVHYDRNQLPAADMVQFKPANVSTWAVDGQLLVQFFCGIPTYQFVTAQGWVMTMSPGTDDQAQLQTAFVAAQSS
ncbi:uncharacterized protein PG998_000758 [Apiospora kogelbergensis]|uniref:uncharacterized protein n=1 Tax=Apiospora kogelbergensis TaxID=1337665 RepID=UPI003130450A